MTRFWVFLSLLFVQGPRANELLQPEGNILKDIILTSVLRYDSQQRQVDFEFFHSAFRVNDRYFLCKKFALERAFSRDNLSCQGVVSYLSGKRGRTLWAVSEVQDQNFTLFVGDAIALIPYQPEQYTRGRLQHLKTQQVMAVGSWADEYDARQGRNSARQKLSAGFRMAMPINLPRAPYAHTYKMIESFSWQRSSQGMEAGEKLNEVSREEVLELETQKIKRAVFAHMLRSKEKNLFVDIVKERYPLIDFSNERWSEKFSSEELRFILYDIYSIYKNQETKDFLLK